MPRPASTEYYCNVPGHKEAGMVGTLTVTEGASAAAPAGRAAPGATPAQGMATAVTPDVVTPAGPTTEATPAAGGQEQAAAGASNAVEVDAYDIYFEPKELTIPANTDVTVRIPNEGVTPHNFSIDELGISVDIDARGHRGDCDQRPGWYLRVLLRRAGA